MTVWETGDRQVMAEAADNISSSSCRGEVEETVGSTSAKLANRMA